MNRFSKTELNKKAKELGFVRDTFEKVFRLADILYFIESDSLLSNNLALKGGTAKFADFVAIGISAGDVFSDMLLLN